MRALVKVGGAQIESPSGLCDFVESVKRAREHGHDIVVVHGGGNQIRAYARRLSLAESYHEGLRVTDAETADLVLMVLGGLVNREIVHAFERASVRAVGLTGADGSSFAARKELSPTHDLGYVGAIERVDPRLCDVLLAAGFMPVIATPAPLAPGLVAPRDHFYNVNADLAAAPLAASLRADAVLFLTDVAAVLDAHEQPIERLTTRACTELRASGVIRGGMIPKVEAACLAAVANPRARVVIASAQGPDAVLRALAHRTGTRVEAEA